MQDTYWASLVIGHYRLATTGLPASANGAPQCIPDDEVRHGRRYAELTHTRCVLPPMMLAVHERLEQEDPRRSFKRALGSPRQSDPLVKIGGRQKRGHILMGLPHRGFELVRGTDCLHRTRVRRLPACQRG